MTTPTALPALDTLPFLARVQASLGDAYRNRDSLDFRTDLGLTIWCLFGELAALCDKKQQDYGSENLLADGVFGVVVRSGDKLARIRNLTRTPGLTPAVEESIADTWLDLCNYAGIGYLMATGLWPQRPGQQAGNSLVVERATTTKPLSFENTLPLITALADLAQKWTNDEGVDWRGTDPLTLVQLITDCVDNDHKELAALRRLRDDRASAMILPPLVTTTTHGKAVEIAKRWPGHAGVDWAKTTTNDILDLIGDALGDPMKQAGETRTLHLMRTARAEIVEFYQTRDPAKVPFVPTIGQTYQHQRIPYNVICRGLAISMATAERSEPPVYFVLFEHLDNETNYEKTLRVETIDFWFDSYHLPPVALAQSV